MKALLHVLKPEAFRDVEPITGWKAHAYEMMARFKAAFPDCKVTMEWINASFEWCKEKPTLADYQDYMWAMEQRS